MSDTASDIMPILVNSSQQFITALGNFEVFDGISMLEILIGLFALSIVADYIYWLRNRGGGAGEI